MYKIPLVAVLGRPNVGKSTLFNRLIKQRKAIIDPTPGVTRDMIYGMVEYENHIFKIVDTGGLTNESDDELNFMVQNKSQEALKEADLIIFMVEYGNPLPIEIEYIDIIRKSGKKAIIVVNKCDSPERDILGNEYFQYGLGEPLKISANHNRNVEELLETIISLLPEQKEITDEEIEKEEIIKIAIVGKPNVGKSSILNKMLGKERSIVSSIAETTRDVVDGEFMFFEKKIPCS